MRLTRISNQLINVNTLNNTHKNLIASFFDEENLEFIESQILDAPENGYDSANEFAKKITQSAFHHRSSALTQKPYLFHLRYIIKLFPISWIVLLY